MMEKISKTLKTKWRKCKTQILNLEELKNKHAETNNTITEIKNSVKGSIAEYLKQKNESVSWKIKGWK